MRMKRRNLLDRLYCILPFTYIGILNGELKKVIFESILDIGGGSGRTFKRIRRLVPVSYAVELDIFEAYISQAKAQNAYDDYILTRASSLPFEDISFDVIIALQLIEHMPKEEALITIKEIERVAKKKVIITTPRGIYSQEAYDGNPYQEHKSSWDIDEMESLGYKVILCGTRFVRYKGTFLNKLFSYLISVACLLVSPNKTGGGMICIKEIESR